jgi:hypothetical protein
MEMMRQRSNGSRWAVDEHTEIEKAFSRRLGDSAPKVVVAGGSPVEDWKIDDADG